MAQGGPSQAQLKKDLDQLSHDLLNVDLQIQYLKQAPGNNTYLHSSDGKTANYRQNFGQRDSTVS